MLNLIRILVALGTLGMLSSAYAAPGSERLLQAAERGFPSWDDNSDGVLSASELDRAIASPAVKSEEAAAAVALRRVLRSRSLNVRELRLETVRQLAGTEVNAEEDDEGARDGARSAVQYFDTALRRITTTNRSLFVSGTPSLPTFSQGRLGSCFSLAPLGALLHRNPAEVVELFVQNDDGSVTVLFEGGRKPVIVPQLTDGEIALASSTGNDGVWSAVYEKAVGLLRTPAKPGPDGRLPTPYAVVTRGGSAGSMLSILTGMPIERFSCRPWRTDPATPKDELERKLTELRGLLTSTFEAGLLATAGTPGSGARVPRVPQLAQSHAYAVLAYDPATDRVTLRDPHGQTFKPRGEPGLKNGYRIERGVWSAPLTEVVQFMGGFAFQKADVTTADEDEDLLQSER